MGRVEKHPCTQSLLEQRWVRWRWELSARFAGLAPLLGAKEAELFAVLASAMGGAGGVTPAVRETRGGTTTQGDVQIKAELLGFNIWPLSGCPQRQHQTMDCPPFLCFPKTNSWGPTVPPAHIGGSGPRSLGSPGA